MQYVVRRAPMHHSGSPDPDWSIAHIGQVANFRPESSSHRPQTKVRLVHDGLAIHGLFEVQDQYVRCVRTQYGDDVWKDSCVEFFIQPKSDKGYFNFEFNCGGAWLCNYITNPQRTPQGFKEWLRLPEASSVRVKSSLPQIVDPEIVLPTNWTLQFFVPMALIETHCGPLGQMEGQVWRGNFFKCAEDNSHPHWAAWSAVDELNFHLPRCFGELRFE